MKVKKIHITMTDQLIMNITLYNFMSHVFQTHGVTDCTCSQLQDYTNIHTHTYHEAPPGLST